MMTLDTNIRMLPVTDVFTEDTCLAVPTGMVLSTFDVPDQSNALDRFVNFFIDALYDSNVDPASISFSDYIPT